jgi:hypothetical protein
MAPGLRVSQSSVIPEAVRPSPAINRWHAGCFPILVAPTVLCDDSIPREVRCGRRAPMIEFLHTYGLWIALAGVFFVMHRFGTGCCSGGQHHTARPSGRPFPDEAHKQDEKLLKPVQKSRESCH